MERTLKYYLHKDLDNPVNNWVFQFISSALGLRLKKENLSADAHIIYTVDPEETNCLRILHNEKDIVEDKILNHLDSSSETWIKFDFVNAIKSFLLDEVNDDILDTGYDSHNRLNSLDSFQKKAGYQLKPIVNYYVNYIGEQLGLKFNLVVSPPYPKGKKGVIILSHDVDDPQKYSLLRTYSLFPKYLSFKKWMFYQLEAVKKALECLIKRDSNVYWAFDEVMEEESKHGFTSTFFFAPISRFRKGANFMHDIPYETSTSEFQKVFRKMNKLNFEIGLHTSYYARRKKGQIKEECLKLENDSEKKLVGNRHHFWQIGPNPEATLVEHIEAGMKYDSSMAFNDAPGYRRSVALPFNPFYLENQKVLDIIEIPTFMMDSNFMKNPEFPQENALYEAKRCIDEFYNVGGVAAIDWHVRTSFPKNKRFKKWGEVYVGILEYLSTKEDIWVTNYETYISWFKSRNKELMSNQKSDQT